MAEGSGPASLAFKIHFGDRLPDCIRAGEERQTIAKHCGTSVEMLERSYSFAIEDLEDEGPQPAEEERLRARQIALAADKRRRLRVA